MKQVSCLAVALVASHGLSRADDPQEASIRQHRMGTLIVKTAPGAPVRVQQLRHEFGFGAAISRRAFTGDLDPKDKEKYIEIVKTHFNAAVHENELKWYHTERTPGEISYRDADAMLAWCEENGLRMRGHCVFWEVEQFVQDWIKALDPEALRAKLKARAHDVVKRYRGRIDEFDVNNEMIHGRFYAGRLGEPIHPQMFRWCKEANPDAILYVNDYSILSGKDLDKYDKHIESLLAAGAPVGGIGLQGHFGGKVDPVHAKRVLDRLAHFKLPIKITEFDMKTLDENAKAKGLDELYRVCFAHPAVEGILMWGFWAKSHWLASKRWGIEGYTALWDKDWNPMPAAKAYENLVLKTWWTTWEGKADAGGRCEVRAFFGRHEVSAAGGAKRIVELSKKEGKKEIDLTAPTGTGATR
jgi:endo-1,4-beta-xylanase